MKKYLKKIKSISKKSLIFIFLILVICLINLRAFFRPGIFRGHDLENHLARIANYYLAIKDHHLPPRWAKNLNHKFGYPVFNYNYPLANILAYPLIVLGFNVEDSLKIILFSAYFFSGLFFYFWLKKHFTPLSSFCGAVFYLCVPYQFLDLYVRGVVGENLSFFLFPAVLYFLKLLFEKKNRERFLGLVLFTALFSLSHNIMVMIFTPLIFLYYFYLVKKNNLKFFNLSLGGLILGFSLTSFFWLPAYFEKSFIRLEAFDQTSFFQEHFVNLRQLIYSPWQYGFSMAGPEDTMSFQIGLIHLFVFFFSLILVILFCLKRDGGLRNVKKFLFTGLILFIFSVFLMLPQSLFIWKLIPLLGYLQFPWRFLALTMVASSILAGVVSEKYQWLGVILALGAFIYAQQFTRPFLWEQKQDMVYYDFLFTTSTRHEHMPRWFNESNINEFKPRLTSDSGLVKFKEILWKTGRHIYEVDVPETTNVWEHTAYFPGWEVFLDGQRKEIKYNHQEYPGLIGVEVPAGQHQIVTKFTEKTAPRLMGDLLSLGSLILLGFISLKKIKGEDAY
jgi:hypothetical protein